MTVGRVIDWLGRLTAGQLPSGACTERVLRVDSVLNVAKMLHDDEFELVRMHDVEGYSIEVLQDVTGMPDETIRENVKNVREQICEFLESSSDSEEAPEPTEIVL